MRFDHKLKFIWEGIPACTTGAWYKRHLEWYGSCEILLEEDGVVGWGCLWIVPQIRERIGIFISLVQLRGLHKAPHQQKVHNDVTTQKLGFLRLEPNLILQHIVWFAALAAEEKLFQAADRKPLSTNHLCLTNISLVWRHQLTPNPSLFNNIKSSKLSLFPKRIRIEDIIFCWAKR